MTGEWVLYECGFTADEGELVSRFGVWREVGKWGCEPVELVVSSVWDARHVYAKFSSGVVEVWTRGRWRGLTLPEGVCDGGEHVMQYVELGRQVLVYTDRGKMLVTCRDKHGHVIQTAELCGLPAPLKSVHAVQEDSKLYAKLSDGCVHRAQLTSCTLELHAPLLPGIPIRHVSCGNDHVLLLGRGCGRVWSSGLNHRGQLGHGDLVGRAEPTVVEGLDGVGCKALACGLWHSLVLSQYGDLYTWGWNADRQLGHSADSSTVAVPTLVEVEEALEFKAVSCGSRHSAALTTAGQLFTWGWNAYGQLNHHGPRPAPVTLPTPCHAEAVVSWVHCEPWATLMLLHNPG